MKSRCHGHLMTLAKGHLDQLGQVFLRSYPSENTRLDCIASYSFGVYTYVYKRWKFHTENKCPKCSNHMTGGQSRPNEVLDILVPEL